MNDYSNLKKYKQGGQDWWNQEDPQAVLKMLYAYYQANCPGDTEKIRMEFETLNSILRKLPLKEHDQVWNLTCRLCAEHEENGFLEGLRAGVALAEELRDDP